MRWVNHHLQAAGYANNISNFGSDLADLNALLVLAHQLAHIALPDSLLLGTVEQKAQALVAIVGHLRCPELVGASDLLAGSERLFLTLLALMFHAHSGLAAPAQQSQQQQAQMQQQIDDIVHRKMMREEEAFKQRMSQEEQRLKAQWAMEEAERKQRWAAEDAQRQAVCRALQLQLHLLQHVAM
jgi:hypothetical protein